MEQAIVSAVTHDGTEAKITVVGVPDRPGVAARLFRALADRGVNVDMIVQNISDEGSTDISFTVHRSEVGVAQDVAVALQDELGFQKVTTDSSIARV